MHWIESTSNENCVWILRSGSGMTSLCLVTCEHITLDLDIMRFMLICSTHMGVTHATNRLPYQEIATMRFVSQCIEGICVAMVTSNMSMWIFSVQVQGLCMIPIIYIYIYIYPKLAQWIFDCFCRIMKLHTRGNAHCHSGNADIQFSYLGEIYYLDDLDLLADILLGSLLIR